jgi:hypothetical protein
MSVKDDMTTKLNALIGKPVQLVLKIKHSGNHVSAYGGNSGTLKEIDQGNKNEAIKALIDINVVYGKNLAKSKIDTVWIDARDISGIEEGKKGKKK